MIYYFTFGQGHVHPVSGRILRNCWYEVKAKTASDARQKIVSIFGQKWSNQYEEKYFGEETKKLFPEGCMNFIDLLEEESFDSYLIREKNDFISQVQKQEWNPDLRVAAENFIIAFDQLRENKISDPVDEDQIRNDFLKVLLDDGSIVRENYNYYYKTISK